VELDRIADQLAVPLQVLTGIRPETDCGP
jgi:hypothetical protein